MSGVRKLLSQYVHLSVRLGFACPTISCATLASDACSFVSLVGTWGDITEDLVMALYNPNQFSLFWTNSTAAAIPPLWYASAIVCVCIVGSPDALFKVQAFLTS
jgi:hypothetical protein